MLRNFLFIVILSVVYVTVIHLIDLLSFSKKKNISYKDMFKLNLTDSQNLSPNDGATDLYGEPLLEYCQW